MRVAAAAESLFHLASAWFVQTVIREVLRRPVGPLPGWGPTGALVVLGVAFVMAVAAAVFCARRARGTGLAPVPAGRALVYAAAGWWLWHVFGGVPRPVVLRCTAAFVLGGLALLRLASPWLGRSPLARPRRVIDVLLGNALLFLVMGEVGVRVVAAVHPTPLFNRSAYTPMQRLAAQRLEPGQVHMGFPANSRGYYDTEFTDVPAGDTVVVSVADSFSLCAVPQPFHFTTVCEEELDGVSVLNAGAPGIGPEEYLYLLQTELLDLHPAALVVNLFLGNDLRDLRADVTETQGWRAWFDAERWLSVLVWQRIQVLREERSRRGGDPEVAGVADPPRTRADYLAAYPFLADPMREESQLGHEEYLSYERSRARLLCDPDPTRLQRLLVVLDQMIARAGDTPIYFVLIPDEFQVEDGLWNELVESLPLLAEGTRDGAQRFLTASLASRGVPCLDLLPVLRAVPPLEDGDRHLFALQDTHFNARGCQVTGEALARFLVEQGVARARER